MPGRMDYGKRATGCAETGDTGKKTSTTRQELAEERREEEEKKKRPNAEDVERREVGE